MRYKIGDRVLVNQNSEISFCTIFGVPSDNEYIVSFDKGWEIVVSNIQKFYIDGKYLGRKAWMINENQIIRPIEYFGIKTGFPMFQTRGLN